MQTTTTQGQAMTQVQSGFMGRAVAMLATAGALLLGLAACGGGEDVSKAQLRLVNASSGYASLDLVVDDQRVRSNTAYGESASYADVDPSNTESKITRPGSDTSLFSTTPTLTRGDHYTLVAYGAEGALKGVLLGDEASEPDSGKARVRVLNGAPEAGNVDVYLTTDGTAIADAEALHSDTAAGATSAFATVDAGTWRLRVTAAGDRDDLRLDLSGLVLASRQIVTLVVTPGAGGVLVNALVLTQQGKVDTLAGAQARVRAVAAVTDSGTVVASVGGVSLMNGSGAPAIGTYRLVPAGAAATEVSVNGVALSVPAATLEAGTDHSLMVWGPAATPAAAWIDDDNRPPTVSGRAKIRLVHGVAGLAGALALTVDFTPRADGVAPGTASAPALLDATSTATLTVTSAGWTTAPAPAVDQVLTAGSVYSLFVVGAAAAPTSILRKDR